MTTESRFMGRRYDGVSNTMDNLPTRFGTLATMLITGSNADTVIIDGTESTLSISSLREILSKRYKMTDAEFIGLPEKQQNKIHSEIFRVIRTAMRQQGIPLSNNYESVFARTELHRLLHSWAAGPLRLEHPQGSSLHHLIDYDERCTGKDERNMRKILNYYGEPQIFVVERDWAKAFKGYDLSDGESPLPFDHCCFEFRISGVRVISMWRKENAEIHMFCVYGRDGIWVSDDYRYTIRDGTTHRVKNTQHSDATEFPRVAKMIMENVRVACIMVDANVAEAKTRTVSQTLIKNRVSKNRAAPRNHFVVDLKRPHARSSGGGGSPSGIKQRGHFRRGTWVHYADMESGAVQYVDDGGFWHSRTWRSWHFAGDPNNLIEKEYRL